MTEVVFSHVAERDLEEIGAMPILRAFLEQEGAQLPTVDHRSH